LCQRASLFLPNGMAHKMKDLDDDVVIDGGLPFDDVTPRRRLPGRDVTLSDDDVDDDDDQGSILQNFISADIFLDKLYSLNFGHNFYSKATDINLSENYT
jgi:hypothetical protein